MKKTPLQILALSAVLSFVGGVAATARDSSDKASEKKILEELAGYRGWTRVTNEPMPVPLDATSLGG